VDAMMEGVKVHRRALPILLEDSGWDPTNLVMWSFP
jgi:hypothetical protein